MKANAPEKIHVQPNAHDRWFEGKIPSGLPNGLFVEYTRTDAFIEKAKKWFEEHFGNRLKWEITTYEFEDIQSMVEDFRKHVMEE